MRIANTAPILFIGDVGEEGEGDLRGMRHIYKHPRWSATIASLIVLDGAGTDTIIAEGLGSRRYEITVRGHGGHSWSDFGVANPIVALARVIDRFTRTPVPASPKTTYNIGIIHGGTSVNSIPESATMRVDTRSASVDELDRLERALHEAVDHVIPEITGRKKQELLTAEVRVIGNRPAADLPRRVAAAEDDSRGRCSARQHGAHSARLNRCQHSALAGPRGASPSARAAAAEARTPSTSGMTPPAAISGLKRILLLTLAMSGAEERAQ